MRHDKFVEAFFNKWVFDLKLAACVNVPEDKSVLPPVTLVALVVYFPVLRISDFKMPQLLLQNKRHKEVVIHIR